MSESADNEDPALKGRIAKCENGSEGGGAVQVTYEHGNADADAPVTWQLRDDDLGDHPMNVMLFQSGMDGLFMSVNTRGDADAICRAFHLAKLAREARIFIETGDYSADWLRRYEAAKGKA